METKTRLVFDYFLFISIRAAYVKSNLNPYLKMVIDKSHRL